ncbi:MAG: hypothetical protein JSS87_04860 [Acidobacteria bacterium]|nr:hypothetical protein [Acidobacteriota bacterium]
MKRVCALLALSLSFSLAAQNASPYHGSKITKVETSTEESPSTLTPMIVTFDVREVGENGKTVNTREFTTRLTAGTSFHACTLRAGSKIPVQTNPATVTYVDVGVKFDCQHARFDGNLLTMQVTAEISSTGGQASQPTIAQNTWDALISLKPGVKTVVFKSDDLASKRTFEVAIRADLIR